MTLLLLLGSGCSLREVQLWFAINQHADITRDQARSIADQVNAKRTPGGCDGNYAGSCVPDNATTVRCAGTSGDSPVVRGPLTVVGWDSFELDPDGDKRACVDPVGNLEAFGQVIDGIGIRGWTFDPDTTAPIQLLVSNDGYLTSSPAALGRGDLAPHYPGVGTDHGFDLFEAAEPGERHAVCVMALNVGSGANTTLGCKSVLVQAVGDVNNGGTESIGVIEQADFVSTGLRVRGFAYGSTGPGTSPVQFYVSNQPATLLNTTGAPIVQARPDVHAWDPAAPAVTGFDFVIPQILSSVCLNYIVAGHVGTLGCRPVGS